MPQDANLRPAPPEFMTRLKRLIDAYHPHLQEARIQVQVRDAVKVAVNRTSAWAQVDTPNNDAEKREFDFTMWYALEAWDALTDMQRDALMDHELTHCIWDDTGKPALSPHTIEEFDAILVRYGVWWPDAQGFVDAINNMPALDGPEGKNMPHATGGYHRPMRGGSSGSTGAGGSSGSTGAGGSSGSTGAGGSSGSTGARVAWTDPAIKAGDDFYTVALGNGEVLELCPDCFAAAAQSIFGDLLAMSFGDAPQPGGSSGSTGA